MSQLEAFMDGIGLGVGSLLPDGRHEGAAAAAGGQSQGPGGGGRHLSAKQRRQMKKAGVRSVDALP
eukprot:scaffold652191_cov33-Prasinocladus_malaysianus.AAC.1